jgi:hypothetical protein
MQDSSTCGHPLNFVRPDRFAVSHRVAMGQLAVDHVSDDLHIAVPMFREALRWFDKVLVDHPQIAETHEPRIVIIGE